MTNNIPEISFITICYNGFKDTCELIESLQNKIHSIRYETIVVDNASREDEAAKIRERYPSVIAIRSNENKGFSGGNNIGIREAKGKYIFLINNDTYIEQDTVSFLIERLESRAEIGGVSPKIRFAFPPIQFFIIKKEYFRHQPYFFNHFTFHQHSCRKKRTVFFIKRSAGSLNGYHKRYISIHPYSS